jgi:hypothetical protein
LRLKGAALGGSAPTCGSAIRRGACHAVWCSIHAEGTRTRTGGWGSLAGLLGFVAQLLRRVDGLPGFEMDRIAAGVLLGLGPARPKFPAAWLGFVAEIPGSVARVCGRAARVSWAALPARGGDALFHAELPRCIALLVRRAVAAAGEDGQAAAPAAHAVEVLERALGLRSVLLELESESTKVQCYRGKRQTGSARQRQLYIA